MALGKYTYPAVRNREFGLQGELRAPLFLSSWCCLSPLGFLLGQQTPKVQGQQNLSLLWSSVTLKWSHTSWT